MDNLQEPQVDNITLQLIHEIISALPQTSENWRGVQDTSQFFETRAECDYIRVFCEPLYKMRQRERKKATAYRCDIYPSGNKYTGDIAYMRIYCERSDGDYTYMMKTFTDANHVINDYLLPNHCFRNKHVRDVEESTESSKRRKIEDDPVIDTYEDIENFLKEYRIDYIKIYNDNDPDNFLYFKIELENHQKEGEITRRFIGIRPSREREEGKLSAYIGLHRQTRYMTHSVLFEKENYERKSELICKIQDYRRPNRRDAHV